MLAPSAVQRAGPYIVLVSADCDIHANAAHTRIRVTHEGIHVIVRSILTSADAPMVFVLEGGYDLPALIDPVKITIEEMLRFSIGSPPAASFLYIMNRSYIRY